jgi:hypothetical protein
MKPTLRELLMELAGPACVLLFFGMIVGCVVLGVRIAEAIK